MFLKPTLIIVSLLVSSVLLGQTTSNTNNPDWDGDGDWSGTAPGYDTNQSATVANNSDISGNPLTINDGHTVIINAGVALTTDETVTVKEGGTLIVNGTLTATGSGKEMKIEKGTLIINSTGIINWAGFGTTVDEPATIVVNGTWNIDGDFDNKVTITGSGNIQVGGDLNNDGGTIFGCTDSGDACCMGAACSLPITLLSFSASLVNNSVNLSWATGTEINNDFFTIESLTNGSWTPLGNVKGAGNSTEIIDYNFVDIAPQGDLIYYRLKQTDFDGDYSYSDVIFIRTDNNKESLLYPNPTKNSFYIRVNDAFKSSILVYNSIGDLYELPAKRVGRTYKVDCSRLRSGVYFITPHSLISNETIKLIIE